jgi:hypothetical protein
LTHIRATGSFENTREKLSTINLSISSKVTVIIIIIIIIFIQEAPLTEVFFREVL